MNTANELGLIVGNGAIAENYLSMAESTVLLMLMLLYQPKRTEAVLRENQEKPGESGHWSKMMRGRTIGLVGLGRIARGVIERLRGWDVNIIAWNHRPPADIPEGVTMVDLDTLYRESDIVGVFVVLNNETRNMIDEHALSLMKPTAYLVNTARGGIVDETALYRALKEQRLAGAALDTFTVEPLPVDSPLRELENVILTPHMIGHTQDVYAIRPGNNRPDATCFSDMAVENILRILRGELPKCCVNPATATLFYERCNRLDALL